jgi:lipopolysaccharide/colanic/teichoic acid biosynthesis glycosyltransferase
MIKRLFDVLFASVALIVLLPVIILISLILLLFQNGPIFFVQERIGKGGKPFHIYKFRSMKITSEQDGQPRLAQINDKRLTTIGRYLRKHHLDELPQFWNVLKGDMSIVGPRPERQFYINQIMERNPRYVELYQIRPGLTSYATLKNGYADTIEKMLRRLKMDLIYLQHQTMCFDLKIILLTIVAMIQGENCGKSN